MIGDSVVRARVAEETKSEAVAVLAGMGLFLSDAFRLLLKRVVAEKAAPIAGGAPQLTLVQTVPLTI